ncbi:MAG: hypothetical protein HHJ15_16640 [Rhodoferax sp.]|uniref:hypothetical protein n=1 Tax=Rhodoferax sp. TaxID=50421 RepID=UPI00178E0F32|nr:hypothetical protein [Rhodoferax sp.]NMM21556.1 hypothetical protein [Rhodoferax sp.]
MRKKQTIPAQQRSDLGHPFGAQQQTVIHHQQQTIQTIFDPDVLLKYKAMVPDAPERVLAVFEKNSETERRVIEIALESTRADNQRRDWMAFVIIIVGMIVSAVFAYLGKEWLSGGALVAIIAYAVLGYLQKNKKPTEP